MTTALPHAFSADEIHAAWGVTPEKLQQLVRAGQVGFVKAGRSRRYLPEHIAQIRQAIEVRPEAIDLADDDEDLAVIGVSPRSRHRRRTA